MSSEKSFTLIELVIVIGILAILATVLVLVINPAELLKQSRDSQRISDLGTINKSLLLYQTENASGFGTANTVYVSIPDSTSTCANLGLPTLPTGYSYRCVTSNNLRNTDSTGWIPVNFNLVSFGSPLNVLPVDPINATSTNSYYSYIPGGSWELSASFESSKYQSEAASDGGQLSNVFELGSNLTLLPPSSLVGWWKMDETSGTAVSDSSGYDNTGTLYGTVTSTVTWTAGKVQNALNFNGTNNYVSMGDKDILDLKTNDMTVSFWLKHSTDIRTQFVFKGAGSGINGYRIELGAEKKGRAYFGGYTLYTSFIGPVLINDNIWHFITVVFDRDGYGKWYTDAVAGTPVDISSWANENINVANAFIIDGSNLSNNFLDDVRVYNRALSTAEINAIYDATK